MTHKETFYPLSTAINRRLRASKLTAAEWRIWLYLVEVDPWGDRYQELDPLTIISECAVSKATLYRAIARFQELNLFDFQSRGMTIKNECGINQIKKVSRELVTARVGEKEAATAVREPEPGAQRAFGIRIENSVSDSIVPSQVCGGILKNEIEISEPIAQSQIRENRPPEPTPVKASGVSQTIQTYSNFKKTLSEDEREGFLKFVRKEIESFSIPIRDVEGWLAGMNKAGEYRYKVYHESFLTSLGVKGDRAGGSLEAKLSESVTFPQVNELLYLIDRHGEEEGKKAWEKWRRDELRKRLAIKPGSDEATVGESVIRYGVKVFQTFKNICGEIQARRLWKILTGEMAPC